MNKGYLFILTTAFLFGTMETALKFFGSLFHPIQITVLRFFIGGFMLLPLARAALKTHGAVLTKKDYLFFAKAGFIGVFVSMIFYQLAVVYDESLDGFFGLFHQTDSCDFLCCHVPRGNCDAQYACWRRADSYWFPDEPLS